MCSEQGDKKDIHAVTFALQSAVRRGVHLSG